MHPILRKLVGGDRRSIGRSNEVVADVLADPSLFSALFPGLQSNDAVLRARVADAVEKITARRPEHLRRYKKALIGWLADIDQKEVRWHVAQILPRVPWDPSERRRVQRILTSYLNDGSSIVKTFAMQALTDLAVDSPALMVQILPRLRTLSTTGTPAMKARGRKLLARLAPSAKQSQR